MITLVGGVAAALVAATVLGGIVAMAMGQRRWSPWLAVLYGYNARYRVTSHDALRGVRAVDVALLLLAAVTYASFWPGPGMGHVVWMTLAIAQPLLGVSLLMVTQLSGRSRLMGGALVLSILMLATGTSIAVAGWVCQPASCSWSATSGRRRDLRGSLPAPLQSVRVR